MLGEIFAETFYRRRPVLAVLDHHHNSALGSGHLHCLAQAPLVEIELVHRAVDPQNAVKQALVVIRPDGAFMQIAMGGGSFPAFRSWPPGL